MCSTSNIIDVSDVKQYFFCPRVIYFSHALGFRERVTHSMEEGKNVHEEIRKKETKRLTVALRRRFVAEEKYLGLKLFSSRLCLSGLLDSLVKVKGEYIPVEYKVARVRGKPPPNHYYQLVAYAILVEDSFSVLVRRGLIYYSLSDKLVEVGVTREAKNYIIYKVLPEISRIMEGDLPRVKVSSRKCRNCGYLHYCRRI